MLGALFAATYPDRTTALCLDGPPRLRWAPDYPWGYSDEREESDIDAIEIGAPLTVRWTPKEGTNVPIFSIG